MFGPLGSPKPFCLLELNENMKHVYCLIGSVLGAATLVAQTTYFPPNPDFDNNGKVTSSDLVDFLGYYNLNWGINADSPVPDYSQFADFEGTIYQIWNEELLLDSLLLHFRLEGVHEWYPIGSTELQTDTIVYERTEMLYPNPWNNFQNIQTSWNKNTPDGGAVRFELWRYGSDNGEYRVDFNDFTATGNYLMSIGFKPWDRAIVTWHITQESEGEVTMDEAGWHYNNDTFQGAPLTEFECIPYFSTN